MPFSYLRRNSDGTLSSTYLIQRLNKPHGHSPFAFGGGLKNGGLSNEAMGMLGGIFSFDYMGAAEFEFGSVPEALHAIATDAAKGDLIDFSFEFDKSKIQPDWRKDSVQAEGKATIYVLCHKNWVIGVQDLIESLASERYNSKLKETTRLAEVLDPPAEYAPDTRGWLELNNGFMFFTDEKMFKDTAALFGVEV